MDANPKEKFLSQKKTDEYINLDLQEFDQHA